MKKVKSRLATVLWRWARLVALGIAGAAAICFLAHPFDRALTKLTTYVGGSLPAPGTVLLIVILALLIQKGGTSLLGLRHFLYYPPTWYAGFIGLAYLPLFLAITPSILQGFGLDSLEPIFLRKTLAFTIPFIVIVPAALQFAVWAISKCQRRFRKAHDPRIGSAQAILNGFENLKKWFENDAPLLDPDDDVFGTQSQVAERIANRLAKLPNPDTALVAPLGAGKSTVLEFTRSWLRRHGFLDTTVAIVSVSLWPFEDPRSAVAGILSAINREFGSHVSTLGLARLPAQYISAIASLPGLLAVLGKLLQNDEEPETVLAKYDEVAVAIGVRFVIWVEDLERFAAPYGESKSKDDALRLVRVLLYLLGKQQNMSVVISSTTLDTRFDVSKIARFSETIARLDPRFIWDAVSTLREKLYYDIWTEIGVQNQVQSALHQIGDKTAYTERLEMMTARITKPVQAIAVLIDTPRSLKRVLRSIHDSWGYLEKKVDFDDLVMATVLRECEPPAFAVIEDHINELKPGLAATISKVSEQSEFEGEISKLENKGARSESVRVLIDALFGKPSTGNRDILQNKPQSIIANDNWSRFMSPRTEQLSEDAKSLPRAIRTWLTDEGVHTLASLLVLRNQGDELEKLGVVVRAALLPELLVAVVREYIGLVPPPRSEDELPSVISVWRLMLKHTPEPALVRQALEESLEASVPVNLVTANCLLHYFCEHSLGVQGLIPPETEEEIVKEARRTLASLDKRTLIKALGKSIPFTLWWVCWGLRRIRDNKTDGLPFDQWPKLAATLASAATQSPLVVLPQLVPFVMTIRDYNEEGAFRQRAIYNREAVLRLFGDESALLSLFRQAPPLPVESESLTPPYIAEGYEDLRRRSQAASGDVSYTPKH